MRISGDKMDESLGEEPFGQILTLGAKRAADAAGFQLLPRRWVVERTLGWISKCRGLLVRYEKKACNYVAQLQLCCALLWFRRTVRLGF